MATKIKRCLFVGLGGTGMNTLLHTKKMLVDTYGKVPPMIGFLGIDTDGGSYKKTLDSKYGKVGFVPSEQLPITVENALPIYEVNKERLSWIPEQNLYALTSMMLGAGQVRSNGRFAMTVNCDAVGNKIKEALDKITSAEIIDNPEYELLSNKVEIHMVFSVCGGTGSGTFINMAYLLKEFAKDCKLTGYAVLPDVFESMAKFGMAKVKPNAYGAIQDLDWLMHLGIGKDSISIDYLKRSYEVNERPFNAVMFIDNKNKNGDAYLHVDQLAEMMSLALVTSVGELSTASASVSDNLEKNIREGSMNIENKKAWVGGLGVCEITFCGQDLSDIYSIKAAKRIIERLLNSCVDTDIIVNNWIDSTEVKIRENGGDDNNDVIDFLLKKEPKFEFSIINDCSNAKPEVDGYISTIMPKENEIGDKISELSTRVKKQLHKLLVTQINKECGVTNVEKIITGIQSQINIFLNEMKQELSENEDKRPRLRSSIEIASQDLSALDKTFFGIRKKNKIECTKNDIFEITMQLAICEREILRRKGAITFFTTLQAALLEEYDKINQIKRTLVAINSDLTDQLAQISNRVGKSSQTFQIDLAQDAVQSIKVIDEEMQVQELVNSLRYTDKIYEFADKDKGIVESAIMAYTNNLTRAKSFKNATVDDAIEELDDEKFNSVLKIAHSKALPLFRYDPRGYTPNEMPNETIYIGIPDKKNSRLVKNDAFKNSLQSHADIDFSSIGVKDRIIIYRQFGVVPAFTIGVLNTYEEKYKTCDTNCHFDAKLLTRMGREEYSLYPRKAVDDTLELWMLGFVFGLIKNEEGIYYFKSNELGDPLDDYWVMLAKEYRDDAYDVFRKNKVSIRKEFEDEIEMQEKARGEIAIKALFDDIKANYYENYSQIGISKSRLKEKGYEKIATLMRDELTFVKNLK